MYLNRNRLLLPDFHLISFFQKLLYQNAVINKTLIIISLKRLGRLQRLRGQHLFERFFRTGFTGTQDIDLNNYVKHSIEKHWHMHISKADFDPHRPVDKFYVLGCLKSNCGISANLSLQARSSSCLRRLGSR